MRFPRQASIRHNSFFATHLRAFPAEKRNISGTPDSWRSLSFPARKMLIFTEFRHSDEDFSPICVIVSDSLNDLTLKP
jgi:hypothetical protein